jgi:anti-sigma B factor antagonist
VRVPVFDLSSQERDSALVVSLSGDLDIVTSRQLDDALTDGRRTFDQIVLDLSAVEFMDTSSLAVIVSHWKKVTAAGGSLGLAGARYQYTKTLWITGLADRIPMFDTIELAITAGEQQAVAGSD